MRRSLSLVIAAAACVAQERPSAEQILDRFVEVTGGKAAYEKLTSESISGVMEMKSQGIKGKMTGYRTLGSTSYNVLEIDGIGKVEEGFYKGIAWEKSAMTGPRIKSDEEKGFFEREATLAKELRWRDLYTALLGGEETIDGVPCYKIILTPKQGRPETHYFEQQTGLRRRTSLVMSTQMGDLPVELTMMDYREFGGIKVPAKVLNRMAGQEMLVTIEQVEHNKQIPAERFVPPADVQALAAKK